MAKAKDHFLKQLKRRQEAATSSPSTIAEKPLEQMSGEELDEALDRARRNQTEQFTEPTSGENLLRKQPLWKIREFWEGATRACRF
jgi:hypothetical protein